MARRDQPTVTERLAQERRISIARKAMEIFVADGDTSATVERIAEAAGVTPRTFHRHFAAKEDVVLPIFRASWEAVIEALAKAPESGDLVEALVAVWTSEFPDGRLSDFDRAFLKLMVTTPQYRLRWLEADDDLYEAVADLLRRRISLEGDPLLQTLPAYLIVHATRHVFDRWLTSETDEDLVDMLRRAFRITLAGVGVL
ncbi:TetR/AcrR family transcriptional regulator [Actinocorallia populi]|uniref:TetR/AcrR family transcriptional regulator n=1 Tax=Actinocorallia populi TaxID=2079200 RepID=UPI0018E4E7A5|nr:TetR/AcrR family transcriptional regulator [Actinocorallia populi]